MGVSASATSRSEVVGAQTEGSTASRTCFPAAAAILAALPEAFNTLDAAETAVKTRAKGTVAARNAAGMHIVAKAAAPRASYDWEWSNDGGKTWVALPKALRAKISLAGIPVGLDAQLRVRTVTTTGVGDSSAATSFLVK